MNFQTWLLWMLHHQIISNKQEMESLGSCSHEEADTRIFVHLKDMVLKDLIRITIRTVEIEVFILAISIFLIKFSNAMTGGEHLKISTQWSIYIFLELENILGILLFIRWNHSLLIKMHMCFRDFMHSQDATQPEVSEALLKSCLPKSHLEPS